MSIPKKPVIFHPAKPAGKDGKGRPDGVAGKFGVPAAGALPVGAAPAADGYDSERDDPPYDYYHGQWRDHDRKRNPDAREHKKQRDKAEGWLRSELDARTPDSYARGEANRYTQPGGYCMATCAAYFYLRHSLRCTPAQCITYLKDPWFKKELPVLQSEQGEFVVPDDIAFGLWESNCMTQTRNRIREHVMFSRWHGPAPRPAPTDIVYLRMIGVTSAGMDRLRLMRGENYSTSMSMGSNVVNDTPHRPPGFFKGAKRTMQHLLFSGYQEPRKTVVPNRGGAGGNGERCACPFVLLDLSRGIVSRMPPHVILVDFSDPAHLSIFDPNHGYMESKQGFCYLSFEQVLRVIWEDQFKTNLHQMQQGFRHMEAQWHDFADLILTFQIYTQTLL